MDECRVGGCHDKAHIRGYCRRHYERLNLLKSVWLARAKERRLDDFEEEADLPDDIYETEDLDEIGFTKRILGKDEEDFQISTDFDEVKELRFDQKNEEVDLFER